MPIQLWDRLVCILHGNQNVQALKWNWSRFWGKNRQINELLLTRIKSSVSPLSLIVFSRQSKYSDNGFICHITVAKETVMTIIPDAPYNEMIYSLNVFELWKMCAQLTALPIDCKMSTNTIFELNGCVWFDFALRLKPAFELSLRNDSRIFISNLSIWFCLSEWIKRLFTSVCKWIITFSSRIFRYFSTKEIYGKKIFVPQTVLWELN